MNWIESDESDKKYINSYDEFPDDITMDDLLECIEQYEIKQ